MVFRHHWAGDLSAGELLRAGIYWRGQRWASAASTTETLLGQRWLAGEKLSSIEQSQVVQLAVSYYMAGDSGSLKGLNRRYGDKIHITRNGAPTTPNGYKTYYGFAPRITINGRSYCTKPRNRTKSGAVGRIITHGINPD